ncbi:uncharacterized protein PFL1_05705 [Pseudozyma flocculosa PF-1]|uniref:Related to FRE4 - Ferric reductase n=2 Tax=Pseudozyma flocculosa TaxID=84751 RepID=A0A5C3F956_9BASI|nr:uncharacterized protein PFL1_05705 [Pseudozyma flocculosa PF-1]EPQ26726.1 hypothetical protein PFL1_05705 [Pseudozyma flocculosa PF-1]SPO40952.1 related to FRE4 - Ferric reductase [Pseudozyma flocculosa]
MLPWVLDDHDLGFLKKYPPEKREDALQSLLVSNRNSFKVPTISIFVEYGIFISLILACGLVHYLPRLFPTACKKLQPKLAPIRTHLLEAPLLGRRNAEPIPLFGLRWLTFQMPLRLEGIVLLALFLINLLPITAFYTTLAAEHNPRYPGPHSHRQQMQRYLADRTAVLAIGQVPLLFLMAGRRSPTTLVSGLSMNAIMLYHRWIARMVWCQAFIHAVAWTVIRIDQGRLVKMYQTPYWNWGVAAFMMFGGLIFLSLRSLRQKWYECFVFLHILMALLAVVGIYFHIHLLHSSSFRLFVIMTEITAAIWAFDRAIRFFNRLITSVQLRRSGRQLVKVASADVEFLANNKVARLRISLPAWRVQDGTQSDVPGLVPKLAAGYSIMLSVPRLQIVGDHPFSIAKARVIRDPKSEERAAFIDVLVNIQGGMTKKLLSLAGSKDIEGLALSRSLSVIVDGPYDHQLSLCATDHLLLYAGGIGVTYCLPFLEQHVYRGKFKTCKLVWMLRDLDLLEVLDEPLGELDAAADATKAKLFIDVYHTASRASEKGAPIATLEEVPAELPSSLSSSSDLTPQEEKSITGGLDDDDDEPAEKAEGGGRTANEGVLKRRWRNITFNVHHGRPDGIRHLDESVAASRADSLSVVCCGPRPLCDWARNETLQWRREREWADIDFHAECVLW